MTMEDIIDENDGRLVYTIADARNLVAIAVAAEREACAAICDHSKLPARMCAIAIRARGDK